MTPEELRNAAVLVRRGSWFAPELFEEAADEIERLRGELHIEREAHASALARNRQLRDELEGRDDAAIEAK